MKLFFLFLSLLILGCSGGKSSTAPVDHTPFLESPSDFSVVKYEVSGSNLILKFSESSKASSYVVKYGTSSDNLDQILECVNMSCSVPVSGQNSYFVQVVSKNNTGTGSTIVYYIPDPLHQISINSNVVVTKNSATLTWSSTQAINSYSVWIGTASGNYTSFAENVSSPYTITSLRAATNYYFQIRGVDASGNTYISNELSVVTLGCDASEYNDNGSCFPQVCSPSVTSSCVVTNGTGIKTCNANGSVETSCQMTQCDSGHYDSNGSCLPQVCLPNQTVSCGVSNATSNKTCNEDGSAYSSCSAIVCDAGFYESNGSCVAQSCTPNQTVSCGVANATSNKTCNAQGSSYSSCSAIVCNGGFYNDNGSCVTQVCSPNAVESCNLPNGSSSKTCNTTGSSYGQCSAPTCNGGYYSTGSGCDAFSVVLSNLELGKVEVSWSSTGASSYNIDYGTTASGTLSSTKACTGTSCVIDSLTAGTSYKFKVSSTNAYGSNSSQEYSITTLANFTDSFNFSVLLNYDYDTATTEFITSGGLFSLIKNNGTVEKTSNGTGTGSNIFDNYESKSSDVTLASDLVTLSTGLSGDYISSPIDGLNNISAWNQFNFHTLLPYGKEIATLTESGYGGSLVDNSVGLVGLWHLNETTLSSGTLDQVKDAKGTHNGQIRGGVTSGSGVFKGAFSFDGVHGSDVIIPDSDDLDSTNKLTISAWVYPTLLDGTPRAIVSKRTDIASEVSYSMFFNAGNKLYVDIGDNVQRFSSNTVFSPNQWYHVVLTYNGTKTSATRANLYVNGVLDKTAAEGSSTIPNKPGPLFLGAMNENYSVYYKGLIDEVAIWNTEANLAKVQQLFQRGVNKIKFQVRTCTIASGHSCSGDVTSWVGPDGTSSSYFSESDNYPNPLTQGGTVNATNYQIPWSSFTNGLTAWMSTGSNATNRYIQYKAVLQTASEAFRPSLIKTQFLPVKYATQGYSSTKISINVKNIKNVTITDNCSNLARYDFSSDGSNYLSWNGSSWVSSTSTSTANTKVVAEGLTEASWKLFPLASTKIYTRVFLNSTGASACSIDRVSVTGTR